MAITISVAMFNIFLAKHLPLVEILILVMHLAGFVAIIAPLWAMAPRTPSSEVWTSFTDANDWGSSGSRQPVKSTKADYFAVGVACLVGTITSVGSSVGGDAAAHMAEELKDASRILPRVMIWTVGVNMILGSIVLM